MWVSRLIMHKKIFLLSLPLILSNIALPFLGLVNTSLIGHLHSSNYLAATGLGVSSITFMCFLFSFFRMSVTGMVAQEKARSNQSKELALILIRAVVVAFVIIVLLLICKGSILKVFTYIYHMDSHVSQLFVKFYNICIYVFIFAILNYIFVGFFIGVNNTKIVFYSSILMMFSGILLSFILVNIMDMNVIGIAISLVLSSAISTIFLFVKTISYFKSLDIGFKSIYTKNNLLCIDKYTGFLRINSDIFIRSLCLLISINSFYIFSSYFGKDILAANTILVEVAMFVTMFLDAIANVTETFVARAYVLRNISLFKEVLFKTLIQCTVLTIILVIFYIVFNASIVNLFTSIPSIKAEINKYMIYSISLPLIASFSYWIDGVFIGMLKTQAMRNSMIISALMYVLSVFILQPYANDGLWISLFVFYIARVVTLTYLLNNLLKREIRCLT